MAIWQCYEINEPTTFWKFQIGGKFDDDFVAMKNSRSLLIGKCTAKIIQWLPTELNIKLNPPRCPFWVPKYLMSQGRDLHCAGDLQDREGQPYLGFAAAAAAAIVAFRAWWAATSSAYWSWKMYQPEETPNATAKMYDTLWSDRGLKPRR